jgi:NAD(P)-dependent dehydrogenase (short-subunit alcohol dehydrogenase family)
VHPAERCLADADRLAGVTVLVTGASDGIGRETALALGRRGASVLVHGRDEAKAAGVVQEVEATDGEGVGPFTADFLDLDAVRALAATAEAHEVDVLVNNAGATFSSGGRSDLGVERTIHVNHLGPFVLTNRLLPRLRESDGPTDADDTGRVVVVASEAHQGAPLDLPSFGRSESYDQLSAYRQSKLANLAFTFELARREAKRERPVPVNATHPGFVPGSALWRDVSLPVRAGIGLARRLPDRLRPSMLKSEADGAAPSVYLAAAETTADWMGEYVTGCHRIEASEAARDRTNWARLWSWSAEVTREGTGADEDLRIDEDAGPDAAGGA